MSKNAPGKEYTITVTNKTIVRILLVAAAAAVVLKFTRSVSQYLALIGIGAFVALALNPLVGWVHKHVGGKRPVAIIITFLALFSMVVGLLSAITPALASQTANFIDEFPSTLNELKTGDSTAARWSRDLKITEEIDNLSQDFSNNARDIGSFALNVAGRITNAVVSIIAIVVLAFMMLIEGPKIANKFWQLPPVANATRYRSLAERMYETVTGYVNGQIVVSAIGAAVTLLLLLIVGVPNALLLAGFTFLVGLIPLVGLPFGAAFIVLLGLFSSVDRALVLLVFYIIYWQIQNSTIQPYILSKSSDMSPLTVFMAALIGIEVGGILGALIAVPVAGCLRLLVLDYISQKRLIGS